MARRVLEAVVITAMAEGIDPVSAAQRPMSPESSMYFDYLRRIEHAVFPLMVTEPDELIHAECLRLAGMITVREKSTCDGENEFADRSVVIHEITLFGHAELLRQKKQSPWAWRERREG